MTEFDKQNQSPYKLRIGEEIKIKKIKKKKKGLHIQRICPFLMVTIPLPGSMWKAACSSSPHRDEAVVAGGDYRYQGDHRFYLQPTPGPFRLQTKPSCVGLTSLGLNSSDSSPCLAPKFGITWNCSQKSSIHLVYCNYQIDQHLTQEGLSRILQSHLLEQSGVMSFWFPWAC